MCTDFINKFTFVNWNLDWAVYDSCFFILNTICVGYYSLKLEVALESDMTKLVIKGELHIGFDMHCLCNI